MSPECPSAEEKTELKSTVFTVEANVRDHSRKIRVSEPRSLENAAGYILSLRSQNALENRPGSISQTNVPSYVM